MLGLAFSARVTAYFTNSFQKVSLDLLVEIGDKDLKGEVVVYDRRDYYVRLYHDNPSHKSFVRVRSCVLRIVLHSMRRSHQIVMIVIGQPYFNITHMGRVIHRGRITYQAAQ